MNTAVKIARTAVTVNTRRYQTSHGHLPRTIERGGGCWLFEIAGENVGVGPGTYGQCRRIAVDMAAERGVREIIVLP